MKSRFALVTTLLMMTTILVIGGMLGGVTGSDSKRGVRGSSANGKGSAAISTTPERTVPGEMQFMDDFNNLEEPTRSGWAVVNETATGGSSAWSAYAGSTSGVLKQGAAVGGEIAGAPYADPGTYVVGGNSGWKVVDASTRMKTSGDGAIGLMIRHASNSRWIRFSWNQRAGVQTLVKRSGATYKELATRPAELPVGAWQVIRARAEGSKITVWVNGDQAFSVTDDEVSSGKIGLYSWGNGPAYFDDVDVRASASTGFTIAVLPDTQFYSAYDNGVFEAQTEWIAKNRGAERIAFVVHEGDVVGAGCNASQWAVASRAMRKLAGKVPYAITPGNHDIIMYASDGCGKAGMGDKFIDRSFFNSYFPLSRLKADNPFTWSGAYIETDSSNTWHTFTAAGVKYLVVALQFGPRSTTLEGISRKISEYPDHKVILLTHDYLSAANTVRGVASNAWSVEHALASIGRNMTTGKCLVDSTTGLDVAECQRWPKDIQEKLLKRHPNIQFVFSGHVVQCQDATSKSALDPNGTCGGGPTKSGWAGRLSKRYATCTVSCTTYQMLANYQGIPPAGGNGFMRLIRVDPADSAVAVQTWSPTLGTCLSDNRNKFSWPATGVSFPPTPCPAS